MVLVYFYLESLFYTEMCQELPDILKRKSD